MSGIVGTSHSKSKVIGRSYDTAKAWAHVAASGTFTVENSFGLSSVDDVTTGHSKYHFITPFATATSYVGAVSTRHGNNESTIAAGLDQSRVIATTTGYLAVMTGLNDGTSGDHDPVCVIVFGKDELTPVPVI